MNRDSVNELGDVEFTTEADGRIRATYRVRGPYGRVLRVRADGRTAHVALNRLAAALRAVATADCVVLPSVSKRPVPGLTIAELTTLRQSADYHDRGMLGGSKPDVPARLLIELGLALHGRLNEILALRWEDIDRSAGGDGTTVTISGAIRSGATERARYPLRHSRSIELDAATAGLLGAPHAHDEYVLTTRHGGYLREERVRRVLGTVFAHAGLDITFNDVRRTPTR